MISSKLKKTLVAFLSMALIFTAAVPAFAADGDDEVIANKCWTLGKSTNTNGPEEGVQGTNGWYFMYTDEINLGKGVILDPSMIKECTWATKGSMQLKSEGGSYESMWVPANYLAEGLTGDALKQPWAGNDDATFNNWVMTSNGTLNTDVETTAVTGIYAWEAPADGEYKYTLGYEAGGNHCQIDQTTYYYVNDYYFADGTNRQKTPVQREGGVAVSVSTDTTQLDYVECAAMTKEHDYLYAGTFAGLVSLKKGDKIFFAVDPREIGAYDRANLQITVTSSEDCNWDDTKTTYTWDDNNNCTASRVCTTHTGETIDRTVAGEMTEKTKDATCTEAGEGVFKAEFKDENLVDQTATRPIAATGHHYNAWDNIYGEGKEGCTAVEFNEDYTKATWLTKCDDCNQMVVAEECDSNSIYFKDSPGEAADCTNAGSGYYQASFYWGWVWLSSDELEIPALGHDVSKAEEYAGSEDAKDKLKIEWSEDNKQATLMCICDRCGEWAEVSTVAATLTPVDGSTVTCSNPGVVDASVSFMDGKLTDEKKGVTVDGIAHDTSDAYTNFWDSAHPDFTNIIWSEDNKQATWQTKCKVCGKYADVETVSVSFEPAEGSALSCTKSGDAVATAKFWWGWCPVSKTVANVPALGHTWSGWTKDGKSCETCGVKAAVSAKLSYTTATYNGKDKKPTVSNVTYAGETLDSSKYSVSYDDNNKKVGKHNVTIGLRYAKNFSQSFTYVVKPVSTSITKATGSKKAFTVKWAKKTAEVTGYQIQYAKKSSMSGAKTKTVASTKTTSKKITKLSAKKTYYVRVRTYKTVNGVKYYSSWSKVKKVKTK